MTKTKCFTTIITLSFLLLFSLTACEGPQGPQGPAGSSPVEIHGEVYWAPWESGTAAFVDIYESPSIPSVEINGSPITRSSEMINEGFRYRHANLPVSPGDSLHLCVDYIKSNADSACGRADLLLPGTFTVTFPDTTTTMQVPVGSNVTLGWTPSVGADAYNVVFAFVYYYYDSLGSLGIVEFIVDTLIADTAITFDSARLFPNAAAIDSISENLSGAALWAKSGPWQVGEMGNITGDGMGFFYGTTFGEAVYFDIVMPN